MKKQRLFQHLFVLVVLAFCSIALAQSVESKMANGQELLQRGAYSQAVNSFRQVLAAEPDYFEAQFNLGFAYLQWGGDHLPDAVRELKKAIKMQPRNSDAWSNLAIAYENLGKSNESMDALAQAVSCNPDNLTARGNLAATYANANKMPQAIAQYRELVKLDASNGEMFLNLAKCLVSTKSYDEAKGVLKQAIVASPDKGEAHAELGTIYWKNENNLEKGISEYRLAISKEPSNPAFYQDLASALEAKKETKEAVETYKKALMFTDDVLAKDKIQDKIDRLEKGSVSSGSSASADVQSGSTLQNNLEKELRDEPARGTRRINTKSVNVSKDFSDVNADTNAFDLNKEAKKRAQQKKAEGK